MTASSRTSQILPNDSASLAIAALRDEFSILGPKMVEDTGERNNSRSNKEEQLSVG